MLTRTRLPGPALVRALSVCVLALYAAATAGQPIPVLTMGEHLESSAPILSGPYCCPLACAVTGDGQHQPGPIPPSCDLCALVLPLCVAVLPAELAGQLPPSLAPSHGHEARGFAAQFRGPASPRDPPLSA